MFYKPLLYPVLIQVALTFVVWVRLYLARDRELRGKRINPQVFVTRKAALARMEDSLAASDSFSNQFEMPVLFYLVIVIALMLMLQDPILVALAWTYVILRIVHALIHLTYNTVLHRFLAFAMSGLVLLAMWVRLGWYIIIS